MSEQPTSEIVAGLREFATFCTTEGNPTIDPNDIGTADQTQAELIEAADRLEELAALTGSAFDNIAWRAKYELIDALRIPCPTCGGTKQVWNDPATDPHRRHFHIDCPDCSDGLMSHERAWKIVAAVFDPEWSADFHYPEHGELFDSLRGHPVKWLWLIPLAVWALWLWRSAGYREVEQAVDPAEPAYKVAATFAVSPQLAAEADAIRAAWEADFAASGIYDLLGGDDDAA